jgi:hypothetical protein
MLMAVDTHIRQDFPASLTFLTVCTLKHNANTLNLRQAECFGWCRVWRDVDGRRDHDVIKINRF